MAWVVDRKKSWRICWRVDGKEHSTTVSKIDYLRKKDAKEYAAQLEREGECAMSKQSSFFESFDIFVNRKTLAPASTDRYNDVKRYFSAFLQKKYPALPLHRITKEIGEDFKKHMLQSYSPSTAKYSIRLLREFWKVSFRNVKNPFSEVKYPKLEKKIKRPPPKDEMMRVLDWIRANRFQYFAYIYLMARFGSRRNEIRTLKINDVELDNERIYLYKHKDKEEGVKKLAKMDCIVLNEHILYLKRHKLYSPFGWLFPSKVKDDQGRLKGISIGKDTIRKILKRAMKELGITRNYYPHLLRHFVVTYLKDRGYSSINIAKITGHKDPRTIDEWYTHSTDRIVEQMDKELGLDVKF